MSIGVDQQVLRLNVSVTNSLEMYVGQRPTHLPDLEFDQQHGYVLLVFVVLADDARHRVGYLLHDGVQLHLVRLVPSRLESMFELDNVWMDQLFVDL